MATTTTDPTHKLTRTIGGLPAGCRGTVDPTEGDGRGDKTGPDRERHIHDLAQRYPYRFIPEQALAVSPQARQEATSAAIKGLPGLFGPGVLVAAHEVKELG